MKPLALSCRVSIAAAIAFAITLACQPPRASAVTAEVAKTCAALMGKAFPPREPGNPAAGSAAGGGQDQQKYYAKCVANGGHVDDGDAKAGK